MVLIILDQQIPENFLMNEMAILRFLVMLCLMASASLPTYSPSSRHQPPATTVFSKFQTTNGTVRLNINKTMQAIQEFMAFDASELQEAIELPIPTSSTKTSSSAIHTPLYDMDIFFKSSFKDYGSLISHRLSRYARRADWLTSMSNSTTRDSSLRPAAIGIPFVSEPAPSFFYAVTVSIGDPPQRTHLIVDTGSVLSWWKCSRCEDCSKFGYNSSLSSSYSRADCGRKDHHCPYSFGIVGCLDGGSCIFRVKYIDGTVLQGFMAYEKITVVGQTIIENLLFGCPETMPSGFEGRRYIGLLGFGTRYSFIDQMKANSFSLCPPPHTATYSSMLTINEMPPANASIRVPILQHRTLPYRTVEIFGVYVQRTLVEIRPHGSFRTANIDTGSAITAFARQFYKRFRDAFRDAFWEESKLPILPAWSDMDFDTCYNVNSSTSLLDVPKISFLLAAEADDYSEGFDEYKLLSLNADQIMMYRGGRRYCLAFIPLDIDHVIIGSWQLQGTRVSFDLSNQIVQFNLDSCN